MIDQEAFRREQLAPFFGSNPRLLRAFEDQALAVAETSTAAGVAVAATEALQDATVLCLSANGAFTGERVFQVDVAGLLLEDNGSTVTLRAKVENPTPFGVTFAPIGDATFILPLSGTLVTQEAAQTLVAKTLNAPKVSGLANAADDAAAAGAGVPVGSMYRNGSVLMVRVA